jgi:hypothetical protein
MKRVNVNQADKSIARMESFRTRTAACDGLWAVRPTEEDPGLRYMGTGQLPAEWVPAFEKAVNDGLEYVVFSYRTPIAWVEKGSEHLPPAWIIVIPDTKYSPTTSNHQREAQYGLQTYFGMDDYRTCLVTTPDQA